MNYYIQGDAAKAKQIKAAFEAKAIYHNLTFANENYLYYSYDGKVDFCFIGGGFANIIKTHPDYKELKLPVEPKFKVGDWITDGTCKVKITDINNTYYWFSKNCILGEIEPIDKKYHLWTMRDAKDGDVLVTDFFIFLFKKVDGGNGVHYYCHCGAHGEEFDIALSDSLMGIVGNTLINYRPATKEQCDLLFAKMKEAGYEWDEKKKELRKIKPHYDIANFKPYDKVLIRVGNKSKWTCDFFSYYHKGFHCIGTDDWSQCIPFEGNEHLLGTTDPCDERYINW